MGNDLLQGTNKAIIEPFRLSVAIPVYNEESVLCELLQRLKRVLDEIPGGPHEMVFVDDGSSDGTLTILEDAAANDPRIALISFSRNFGHQAALSAALDYVTGDAVILMDGDLQDTPESIPLLLRKFNEGYDVVYAERAKRKEPFWLRLCYYVFYRVSATLSDIHVPLDAGDFGLMSRRVVHQLCGMREHQRYLRGLRSWVGYRQIGIPIERARRHSGDAKYSPARLAGLALDGIFAFSIVPLRAATVLGLAGIGLSGLFAAYSFFARFLQSQTPRGFTALTILITFLSSLHLLFLGIIGEYVGRIYTEAKARPHYVIANMSPPRRGPVRSGNPEFDISASRHEEP